jgi:general secretion pathway protein B
MSYILDALKKSDQQRQRGATPTLQAAQVTVAAPKRPMLVYYGLLAAVLLVTGIIIGWLRPWQPEQPPFGTEPIAVESPISIQRQAAPAPLTAPQEMPGKTEREIPAPNLTRAGQAVPVVGAMKLDNPAPDSATTPGSGTPGAAAIPDKSMPEESLTEKSAGIAGVAQEQQAIPMDELPLQVQREIPAMTVQLHSYSSKPGERLVYINSGKLREGESLTSGLRLEQITPDGMIFSYKGYRFQHGIR